MYFLFQILSEQFAEWQEKVEIDQHAKQEEVEELRKAKDAAHEELCRLKERYESDLAEKAAQEVCEFVVDVVKCEF